MVIAFNPRELITLAIQIEKNGFAYYTRMAKQVVHPEVKEMLRYLAAEEQKHVVDFETLQKVLKDQKIEIPEEYLSPEIEGYLKSLSDGNVFTNLLPVDAIAGEIQSDHDAIRHAITFEKDSVLFFTEVFDLLPDDEPNRKAVAELIRQEKIHIAKLYTILSKMGDKKK